MNIVKRSDVLLAWQSEAVRINFMQYVFNMYTAAYSKDGMFLGYVRIESSRVA